MKCSKAQILISAYLDGELSDKERISLDSHLASCPGCAREKIALSASNNALHLWEDAEPSEWLAQSFAFKLQDLQKQPDARPRPFNRLFRVSAAGLLAVMLAFLFITHEQITSLVNHPRKTESIVRPVQQAKVPEPVHPVTLNDHGTAQKVILPIKHHAHTAHLACVPLQKSFRTHIKRRLGRFKPISANILARAPIDSNTDRNKGFQDQSTSKPVPVAESRDRTATLVAMNHLNNAEITIDSSMDRVRFALRRAADVLSATEAKSESPANTDRSTWRIQIKERVYDTSPSFINYHTGS